MNKIHWIVLITSLLAAGIVPAAEQPAEMAETANQVEFQVSAERDVDNDLSRAALAVEGEDADPARLANRVNNTMRWALEQARSVDGITVHSGSYSTFPVHTEKRLSHWRATQELILESGAVETLNELVGRLQGRLQVRSMSFTISPQRRRAVEQDLIGEALDRFRQRAEEITGHLGARGYEIARLKIRDSDSASPPVPLARTMSLAESSPVASEPGTSTIKTSIDAVIHLRF